MKSPISLAPSLVPLRRSRSEPANPCLLAAPGTPLSSRPEHHRPPDTPCNHVIPTGAAPSEPSHARAQRSGGTSSRTPPHVIPTGAAHDERCHTRCSAVEGPRRTHHGMPATPCTPVIPTAAEQRERCHARRSAAEGSRRAHASPTLRSLLPHGANSLQPCVPLGTAPTTVPPVSAHDRGPKCSKCSWSRE